MRFSSLLSPARALIPLLLACTPSTAAFRIIESNSLQSCSENSGFTASLFQVAFTPNNNTLTFNVVGISTITGFVIAEIDVSAYGYNAVSTDVNPCETHPKLAGLCPMASGQINIPSNLPVGPDVASKIPSIAYTVPDLDGVVQIKIKRAQTGELLACVQADLSNGKTVYQKAVGWVSAVIAGLALLVSAIVSGLGHSNTATHIAANAMSLFGFFQAQAIIGMTAVELPPIVSAWTQNFQWSMGIIHIGFVQDICTWYQQATGGTPSTVLSSLATTSVSVEKRALEYASGLMSRAASYGFQTWNTYMPMTDLGRRSDLMVRSNNDNTNAETGKTVVVHGIDRVGFKADIELTNIFMTGYIFFVVFLAFVILGVIGFKYILEALAKSGKIKGDKFQAFRNEWSHVLRGILFRLVLIGFPQMVVLCFWELTVRDSGGEVALAIITVVTMLVMLAWAAFKVWNLAKRSIAMHKNPAYILYSDPVCLHKWGFLYIQFKATAYWFIVPLLTYLLVKGMFVALAQNSGTAQAVALLILEVGLLVAVSILRPYMDKKTNAFNISIAAINAISALFLLFFTGVFGVPPIVIGVMGVIFFIINAAFALVLLVLVLVATGFAVFSKNPDVRYQPMRDDRGSFIKSQSQLTTELDALGATARGEGKLPPSFKEQGVEDDSHSNSSVENIERGVSQNYRDSAARSTLYGGRTESMRSHLSGQPPRSHTASPWQRGAGYEH